MSDITDAGPRLKAMNDALEEIDRLRKREAELLAAGDRLESQLCEAARERDRLRLTDAEREAVRFCVTASLPETEKLGGVVGGLCRMHAATLRGLLARMSGGGDCPDADKAAGQDNSGLRNGTVDGEK